MHLNLRVGSSGSQGSLIVPFVRSRQVQPFPDVGEVLHNACTPPHPLQTPAALMNVVWHVIGRVISLTVWTSHVHTPPAARYSTDSQGHHLLPVHALVMGSTCEAGNEYGTGEDDVVVCFTSVKGHFDCRFHMAWIRCKYISVDHRMVCGAKQNTPAKKNRKKISNTAQRGILYINWKHPKLNIRNTLAFCMEQASPYYITQIDCTT